MLFNLLEMTWTLDLIHIDCKNVVEIKPFMPIHEITGLIKESIIVGCIVPSCQCIM